MKHRAKKTLTLLIALGMLLSLVPVLSGTAYADSGSDYTFSIPSSLTVQNAGENAAGSISVTALTANKKLTVTAASANSWALKSGDNSVGYAMSKTSWEFTATGSEAFSINVEDYSTKPAGTYQDTVTFTAKVESASLPGIALSAVTSDYIGSVVTADGYVYATVADATSASKTVVAVIAYVGATGDANYNHGLALALTDESSIKMTPENGITAAAAHTPAVTFGTWLQASEAQWNLMINARGSDALRDGFNSVGGTNLQNGYYWSSTLSGGKYRRYDFSDKEWYNGNPGAKNGFVRACLVF